VALQRLLGAPQGASVGVATDRARELVVGSAAWQRIPPRGTKPVERESGDRSDDE
jgi:hypothetical protein